MTTIAIVGARGFLGSALVRRFSQEAQYDIRAVTRENYDEMRQQETDILINCAMPSARFWAKKNPELDFVETVKKTADLVHGWKYQKFVQLSTVSARCQLDTAYGRHKASAEALCPPGRSLIVRCGALYSSEVKKGVLVDMLKGEKVFVDGNSRYCFASVDVVADWIASHLDRTGLVEIGGRNAIALKDIAQHLGVTVEFEGVVDHQEVQDPGDELPEARDVLTFLDNWKPTL